MLANLTMRALDHRLSLLAPMEGWTYTRYADDLAFSRSGKASRIAAMGLARQVAYELKLAGLIHHREKTSVVPPRCAKSASGRTG
jgi:RNA-directed DNA polymerase